MEYIFKDLENRWQTFWATHQSFHVEIDQNKPKYYVLDMFPYPSGAGLHVGHPLGYIASDIIARYKRLKGFNVLHPMGYDSFGLPAEQYAIQTGQHPAITTRENILRYRGQLDRMGFSFDWSREVQTSHEGYYRWTQWIFSKLYTSWYNLDSDSAEPIEGLIGRFETSGNENVSAASSERLPFTARDWALWTETLRQEVLMDYRMAYIADSWVNWCPGLGTVLANEEIKDGFSERGGFPVERKKMRQWFLRITAYADRLLLGLEGIDWSPAIKEMQRNWIGKSTGCSVQFTIKGGRHTLNVFTTRADTIFGCTFLVLAPEHELVAQITTPNCLHKVQKYVAWAAGRSERDRMSEVKRVSGEPTGAVAIHPFTGQELPIWIADYVLAGYGTGAVMAVPCGDERDFRFANAYHLPIVQIMGGYGPDECYAGKEGVLTRSDFLNGMTVTEAGEAIIREIEIRGLGKGKSEYRLRDAGFSRQRYWGEPIPVYYKNDQAYLLSPDQYPLVLPAIDIYLPTETGDPPLGRAKDWKTPEGFPLETNTMPGWAGSSWYYLRYEDPTNDVQFASKASIEYWNQVDLYVGGSEHATGHLLYVRFWTKFLHDLGYLPFSEPVKKLVNQGMIQGRSNFVYRLTHTSYYFSSGFYDRWREAGTVTHPELAEEIHKVYGKEAASEVLLALSPFRQTDPELDHFPLQALHVDVALVDQEVLNEEAFVRSRPDLSSARFIHDPDGRYHCGWEVEKMSKSRYNVVNPDHIMDQYGADTLRMYEMFLGPLEMAKPWNTHGIEGVYRFLKKFWRLFHDASDRFTLGDCPDLPKAQKILQKTIKKVEEDLDRLSFNTSVSQFMICVNELTALNCHDRVILEPLVVLLSPFAPHICEELWALLGHPPGSILTSNFPTYDPGYLLEESYRYPISVNGKVKITLELPLDMGTEAIEHRVAELAALEKFLGGGQIKKIIVVKGRIINVVV